MVGRFYSHRTAQLARNAPLSHSLWTSKRAGPLSVPQSPATGVTYFLCLVSFFQGGVHVVERPDTMTGDLYKLLKTQDLGYVQTVANIEDKVTCVYIILCACARVCNPVYLLVVVCVLCTFETVPCSLMRVPCFHLRSSMFADVSPQAHVLSKHPFLRRKSSL